jgi:hypothetical protein
MLEVPRTRLLDNAWLSASDPISRSRSYPAEAGVEASWSAVAAPGRDEGLHRATASTVRPSTDAWRKVPGRGLSEAHENVRASDTLCGGSEIGLGRHGSVRARSTFQLRRGTSPGQKGSIPRCSQPTDSAMRKFVHKQICNVRRLLTGKYANPSLVRQEL